MHGDNYTLTLFFIVCLFIVYNRRQEIRNPPAERRRGNLLRMT